LFSAALVVYPDVLTKTKSKNHF